MAGLACAQMGQVMRQMVMGTTWKQAGFPLPGIHVRLDICRKMSTLVKVVRVRKELFPIEIHYLFLGPKILPMPHTLWQP